MFQDILQLLHPQFNMQLGHDSSGGGKHSVVMRSRKIMEHLRQLGACESEIRLCREKTDLVTLHERYRRAHSLRMLSSTGQLQERLLQFGACASEIQHCSQKSDLVTLHERYQRAHSLRSANRKRQGQAQHPVQRKWSVYREPKSQHLWTAINTPYATSSSENHRERKRIWQLADALRIILHHLRDEGRHARMFCTLSLALQEQLFSLRIACPAIVRPSTAYVLHMGLGQVDRAAYRCIITRLDLSEVKGTDAWNLVFKAILPHCHTIRELSVSTDLLCFGRCEDLTACTGLALVTTFRLRDDVVWRSHSDNTLISELSWVIYMMPNLQKLDLTRTILGPGQLSQIMHKWLAAVSSEPCDLQPPVCIGHRPSLCLDGCFAHLCATKPRYTLGCAQLICLPRTLHALTLSGNFVRDHGVLLFAPSLEKMTNLHSLDLSCNAIKDTGALIIAKSISTLRSMRALYLSRNHLTSKGAKGMLMLDNLLLLDMSSNCIRPDKLHSIPMDGWWYPTGIFTPSRQLMVENQKEPWS